MQHLKLKSSICLKNYLFLSGNHKKATKSLKRDILCLLSFLASNRIISGIMYCPSVIIQKINTFRTNNAARRGAVRPVGIYFWIMTSGQYTIPYVMTSGQYII